MKFDELNALIPYAKGGKEKVLKMTPYSKITLAMPGRHALDTKPVGGDFVVMVSDSGLKWREHQFTHDDIFKDVEHRQFSSVMPTPDFLSWYRGAITGILDPDDCPWETDIGGVLPPIVFLQAVQCLAVAEHRRYAQFENKYGGRYLPLRFAAGIAEGLWSGKDAMAFQRMGRPGVENLEKLHGLPNITKVLMS